jgi:DNA repair protein RAD5
VRSTCRNKVRAGHQKSHNSPDSRRVSHTAEEPRSAVLDMDVFESLDRPSKRRKHSPKLADGTSNTSYVEPEKAQTETPAKRRFFRDVDTDGSLRTARSPGPASDSVHRSPLAERLSSNALHRTDSAGSTSRASSDIEAPDGAAGFDTAAFSAFVGGSVDEVTLEAIRLQSGNDLERAVNMYFDGTWRRLAEKKLSSVLPKKESLKTMQKQAEPGQPSAPATQASMPASRYIGALGVEGWMTRSGTGLLKHGDRVKIERQKIQGPQQILTKGKASANNVQPRGNSAAARRVDVLVRFTSLDGRELGRLAKDTADWVSTLMDQGICKFEGNCVYAPDRVRTNDTVFLQLRCYLLRSAFKDRRFEGADNRATGLFEQAETMEEKELRLRQVALVRLLQEVNLMPTRGNASAANQQRSGLLAAAEMATQKAPSDAKSSSGENGTSSPPLEEVEDGQELEQDQLDALYKKAQSFDFNTPEAETPNTFAMTLRTYQKQALHWMIAKEVGSQEESHEASLDPLWEEYGWPVKDVDDKPLPGVVEQDSFYVNPYSGELSLIFVKQKQHCLGGILADEMGLGKTIQMLALVHSHRPPVPHEIPRTVSSVNNLPRLPLGDVGVLSAPRTTLVVAPMSLLAQWQSEAEKASVTGSLKTLVYYGSEKAGNLQALCSERNAASAPDLIITSYGIVLSEYTQLAASKASGAADGGKSGSSGLFSLDFFRIILDEAHSIKNRQSKTARACYELAAKHRWVLTGTPIVNRLEDLFSLVRFLRVEPWNNFSFWRTFITVPFEAGDFVRALDVVQTVLEPLVMRRTKDMKTPDGSPLVPLPPKHVDIVDIELSDAERDVYDFVFKRAKQTFAANVEAGTVLKAFTSIFAQILRLRQSCCHPTLVRNKDIEVDEELAGAAADAAAGLADDMDLGHLIERFTANLEEEGGNVAFGAHVLQQIRDEADSECPICAEEPMIDQTVTGCWHSACKKCLLDYIKHQTDKDELPRCFSCRELINQRDLFEVVRHDEDMSEDESVPARISLQRLGSSTSSAKIVALISRLRALRREHGNMKSVIFSQFTSFLSLIEPALERAKIRFVRLDGSLSQKARTAVLSEFSSYPGFMVLLISLKAGGVGLNLTSAKRVFMMDPWWSFAVEAQAIDRVHRMGQEDEVRVYRFIVKQSVEERMLRIQDRKKFM